MAETSTARKAPPRRLPRTNYPTGNLVVPGLGEFAFETVGDTAYSRGVFVYFHREGHVERERACMSFRLALGEDLDLSWKLRPSATDETPPDDVVEAASRHLGAMHEHADVVFMFQALGAIGPILDAYRRELRTLTDGGIFWSRASPTQSMSAERIAAVKADYARRLECHVAAGEGRIARIEAAFDAIREWSERKPGRGPIRDVIESALNPPAAPAP